MKKNKVLAIISSSLGELHVLLPILSFIKEERPNCHIYCVFLKDNVLADAQKDEIYFSILKETCTLIKRSNLLPFLLKNHLSIGLVFKDFNPIIEGTIPAFIRNVCINAKMVLFPHAFALYDYTFEGKSEEIKPDESRYNNHLIDYLFINAAVDIGEWRKHVEKKKIISVGALGYSEWWKQKMEHYSSTKEFNNIKQKAENKVAVLFTLRGVHRIFLTADNYKYLLKTGLEVLFSDPDNFIIIKPHPRQKLKDILDYLKPYPEERWTISSINTFSLSLLAKYTVSFWSSAITDSLAMGKPAIEYYAAYPEGFPQTYVNAQGERVSYYTSLGFAEKAKQKNELETAVKHMRVNYNAILNEQETNFDKIFSERHESRRILSKVLDENIFTVDYNSNKYRQRIINFIQIFIWSQKRLFKKAVQAE